MGISCKIRLGIGDCALADFFRMYAKCMEGKVNVECTCPKTIPFWRAYPKTVSKGCQNLSPLSAV